MGEIAASLAGTPAALLKVRERAGRKSIELPLARKRESKLRSLNTACRLVMDGVD